MKKVYLFSLLLIVSSVLFAQEVKQFVGIVKPIYSEEYKTFFRIQDTIRKNWASKLY